jgi:hypothetical protein
MPKTLGLSSVPPSVLEIASRAAVQPDVFVTFPPFLTMFVLPVFSFQKAVYD